MAQRHRKGSNAFEQSAPLNVLDMFSCRRYRLGMNDTHALRPATTDDLVQALSFALQFEGRKRIHHAADLMAADHGREAGGAPGAVGVRRDAEAAGGGSLYRSYAADAGSDEALVATVRSARL